MAKQRLNERLVDGAASLTTVRRKRSADEEAATSTHETKLFDDDCELRRTLTGGTWWRVRCPIDDDLLAMKSFGQPQQHLFRAELHGGLLQRRKTRAAAVAAVDRRGAAAKVRVL
uniref:Uncharacterized protein n=1 Tax=Cucumis melo TaxID=3656 RepID=A0A9I9CIT5_CUCME